MSAFECHFQALEETLPQIAFRLGDMATVVQRDDYIGGKVVAALMRVWLEGWLKKRGIEYAVADSTQMPPDFFLDPNDKTHNLLEVKAFYSSRDTGVRHCRLSVVCGRAAQEAVYARCRLPCFLLQYVRHRHRHHNEHLAEEGLGDY